MDFVVDDPADTGEHSTIGLDAVCRMLGARLLGVIDDPPDRHRGHHKLNTSEIPRDASVITGPTSGIGYMTALELATRGTVVLVGRSRARLDEVESEIQARGGHAVPVVCDLSDLTSVRRAPRRSSRSIFALTEALIPHLPDVANVVFICFAASAWRRG